MEVNMTEQVDPKIYGLPARTVLIKNNSNEFILLVNNHP